MKHCYLGIENLNLNSAQKKAFVNALKELGLFGGVYPVIRASSLDATQKELILDALHEHGRKLDVARLIRRIDKQQADFDDEEIDAPAPDMTPLTAKEKRGLAKLFDEHEPKTIPALINHWRVRPDGEAIILEGMLNVSVDIIKKFLGDTFGIDWTTINHSVSSVTFVALKTPVVTYSRGGTNYIRFALFGGQDASLEEARIEVREYIKDWDEE